MSEAFIVSGGVFTYCCLNCYHHVGSETPLPSFPLLPGPLCPRGSWSHMVCGRVPALGCGPGGRASRFGDLQEGVERLKPLVGEQSQEVSRTFFMRINCDLSLSCAGHFKDIYRNAPLHQEEALQHFYDWVRGSSLV
jgi:hypothetical protein